MPGLGFCFPEEAKVLASAGPDRALFAGACRAATTLLVLFSLAGAGLFDSGAPVLNVAAFRTFAFAGGFFFATFPAVVESSVFFVSSNAGFGMARSPGVMRVSNAAGLTPAAVAAFAAAGVSGDCFVTRSISGFTMIWLS